MVTAAGKDPARARVIGGDLWLIVSDDPGRTFVECAPHLLYWFNAYARWFAGSDTSPWPHLENKEQILSLGLATIVTPEDAVKHIKARTADVPVELFTMPSETKVRVLEVDFGDEKVTVPRANVEVIER